MPLHDTGDALTLKLGQDPLGSGHFWKHSGTNLGLICQNCGANIPDASIYDAPGSLQDTLANAVAKLGPCDQVARVKGRMARAGIWKAS